jgi:hypothetical protein
MSAEPSRATTTMSLEPVAIRPATEFSEPSELSELSELSGSEAEEPEPEEPEEELSVPRSGGESSEPSTGHDVLLDAEKSVGRRLRRDAAEEEEDEDEEICLSPEEKAKREKFAQDVIEYDEIMEIEKEVSTVYPFTAFVVVFGEPF